LSISFTKGASSTHAPKYEYYKVNSTATTTTTRTWEIPVYNLTPKVETATYTERTPAGTVQLTDAQKKLMKAAWNPQEVTNPDGYIYNDDASAEAAGLALTLPDGSYDRDVNTESEYVATYSYQTTFWGSRSEYYAQKYRYVVTYKIDGSSVPYYLYQNGTGKWIENEVSGDPVPNTNAPEVDKLTMYGGNSFTIKANNGKKISSVKVHFSGSNVIYAPTAGTTKFYLRFTKDGFVGNSNALPEGMSYTVDGDSGEMTWTGVPEAEVTFKLVVYNEKFDWYNSFGDPSSFQYLGSATSNGIAGIRDYNSYEESIIIDQIDVRYK
jgi:hypothetical protein